MPSQEQRFQFFEEGFFFFFLNSNRCFLSLVEYFVGIAVITSSNVVLVKLFAGISIGEMQEIVTLLSGCSCTIPYLLPCHCQQHDLILPLNAKLCALPERSQQKEESGKRHLKETKRGGEPQSRGPSPHHHWSSTMSTKMSTASVCC